MSYDFETLMNDAYDCLDETINNTRLILPKIIFEYTTTRVVWKNTNAYLQLINRSEDHFLNFLKLEYPDKKFSFISNNLIIHSKQLKQDFIHDLAINYINKFVICDVCKSTNTDLLKIKKIYKMECLDCGHCKNM